MNKLFLEIVGDFHPLVVHFPIGIFGLIAISLLLSKLGKIELPLPFFKLINYFCLLSLIVAITLGIASENSRSFSGNDSELLEWHEKLGWATLIAFSLACLLLYFSDKNKAFFKWYQIIFVFSFALLSIGGHLGSTIVHGEIKLIKYFRPKPEKIVVPISAINVNKKDELNSPITIAKIDFDSQIKPIFEENCYKCHGEKKQKGDLRLDTNDFHKVIEKFQPEKSKMYELITLPIEDEDIMPPKDGPLPKEAIELIHNWIKQGAETPIISKEIK